ncbi:phage major capsid protein [Dysgonomonas sp.]
MRNNSTQAITIYTRAAIRPNSYDEAERTFHVTFATETPVFRRRYDIDEPFNEVLSCVPGHIRLERANAGLPLFNNHQTDGIFAILGKVTDISISNKELSGLVRLGARADEALIADIKNGILSGVSVGYNVYKYERIAPGKGEIATYRAIDWEPMEISLAPVQADINSKIRGIDEENRYTQILGDDIDIEEHERSIAGYKARKHKESIAKDAEKLMEEIQAIRENRQQNFINNIKINQMSNEKKREAAEASILNRVAPNVFTDQGGEYRNMTLIELGRSLLRDSGTNISGMDGNKIIDLLITGRRDMATSDFPSLLENVANKILRSDYGLAPEYWERIARRTDIPNFKEQKLYQIGSANDMKEIPEGAEIQYGKLQEAKQAIKVKSYAEGLLFTRQALVNDDLAAFESIPDKFSRDWNLLRGDLVWNVITENVIMHDGKPFFDASHNNLAVTAAGIDDTSLTAALLAFRRQKDIDGKTNIRANPQFIIVGPELEITAKKMLTTIIAAKTGDVNIFTSMGLELIVEQRIQNKSWYMAAGPDAIPAIYYGYLGGEDKLRSYHVEDFNTDSMKLAVRGEFGVAAIDWRGWYKNPGGN